METSNSRQGNWLCPNNYSLYLLKEVRRQRLCRQASLDGLEPAIAVIDSGETSSSSRDFVSHSVGSDDQDEIRIFRETMRG